MTDRRRTGVPGLLAAAWWWFLTLMFHVPAGVGACCVRPQSEFDLITSVYSSPEGPILLILLPAPVASVLAVVAVRGRGVLHVPDASAPKPSVIG